NRALQLALLLFGYSAGHDRLSSRHGDIPERDDRDRTEQPCTGFRQTGSEHPGGTKKLPGIERLFFAETLHHWSGQASGNSGGNDANNHKRKAVGEFIPAITKNGLQPPAAKNVVCQISEKLEGGEPPQFMVRTQEF